MSNSWDDFRNPRPNPTVSSMTQTDKAAEAVPAYTYALNLAHNLRKRLYPENKSWEPLPDILGLLTQIDNMVAGLAHPQEAESLRAEVDRLRGTLKPFGDAVYNDNGDVTIDQSHVHRGHWLTARAALQRKAGE